MTVVCTPQGISRLQLLALRGAVQLEQKGMKRRGRSATIIAKEQLGLPRSAKREEVLAKIEEMLK